MGKIIGIDLGTTNSCVAVVEAAANRVLPNREGSRTTASIVAFAEDGNRLVGQIARRQAVTNPENTMFAVKRLIGRKFDDPQVERVRGTLPYQLEKAPNGDVQISVRGRAYSPEQISAYILGEIKSFAEEALHETVSEAIITVPAYFNDAQRQATKDAGKIAGLEVLRIINEPTAAALAFGAGLSKDEKRTIAVYDLGGGTFDVSILELAGGIFEVRSTAGDTFLGGEDFDQSVMDWLLAEFQQECGLDLRGDRMALQRLKEAAERAKCEVSAAEEAEISLPFIATDDSGPRHLKRTLSREQFETLVTPLIERTTAPCYDALKQANLRPDQVDEVLLVGGQTRSPAVIQHVENIFGRVPNRQINPDEVVAIGAAIQGAILRGDVKDILLLDVTPLSLGVETHGGLFARVIERNSTIPTKNSLIFTTVVDAQDTVEIKALQGEREIAAENMPLGKFELVGIPANPRGVPQIEVSFAIDSNGIVSVAARDLISNKSQSIQISPAGGLSKEEVARLVAEASANAKTDNQRRETRRLKTKIEGLVYSTEKVYDQFRRMLSEGAAVKMHETIMRARMAIANQDDKPALEAMVFELQTVSAQLSELMLAKADAPAEPAPSGKAGKTR